MYGYPEKGRVFFPGIKLGRGSHQGIFLPRSTCKSPGACPPKWWPWAEWPPGRSSLPVLHWRRRCNEDLCWHKATAYGLAGRGNWMPRTRLTGQTVVLPSKFHPWLPAESPGPRWPCQPYSWQWRSTSFEVIPSSQCQPGMAPPLLPPWTPLSSFCQSSCRTCCTNDPAM